MIDLLRGMAAALPAPPRSMLFHFKHMSEVIRIDTLPPCLWYKIPRVNSYGDYKSTWLRNLADGVTHS